MIAFLLSAAVLPFVVFAKPPSFECKRASNPVEQLICAEPELADLDVKLSDAFRKARDLASKSLAEKILSDEKDWLKDGRSCSSAESLELHNCVKDAYVKRLNSFQAKAMGPFKFVFLGPEHRPQILSPQSDSADAFNAFMEKRIVRAKYDASFDYENEFSFASRTLISLNRRACDDAGHCSGINLLPLKFSWKQKAELLEAEIFANSSWREIFANECSKQLGGDWLQDGKWKESKKAKQKNTGNSIQNDGRNLEPVEKDVELVKDFANLEVTKDGFSFHCHQRACGNASCEFPVTLFASHLTKFGNEIFQVGQSR